MAGWTATKGASGISPLTRRIALISMPSGGYRPRVTTATDVARGTAAGAVGAATWAAQQPLDKRVFGSDYDDIELLGKLVTLRRWWPLPGLAVHIANGVLFGAAYALARSHLPGPGWARGLLAAQVENFGLWPLVRFIDHYHPARDELSTLGGNRQALAQATWRHAIFGIVLGALVERWDRAGHGPA
jgi:hypothetical protein